MTSAISEYKPVLNIPAFRRLWLAQLLSLTAQNGIHFVQLVLIERLTGQSLQIGLMIVAFSLPPVIFSFVAGTVIDRVPKKYIIIFSNLFRGVLALSYIFTLRWLDGFPTLLLLIVYAITFLGSSMGSFYNPSVLAKLPLLVGEDKLVASNSLFNITAALAQLFGLIIIAPAAVKLLGLMGSFALMGAFYLIAFLLVLKLPRSRGHRRGGKVMSMRKMWREVREGWVFVVTHRPIYLAVIQLTLVASLLMILAMIAPGFSARVLGLAPEDAVYIFAPAGAGMLLAILFLGKAGDLIPVRWMQTAMLILTTLSFGTLALISFDYAPSRIPDVQVSAHVSTTMLLVGLTMLPLGFSLYIINTLAQTELQRRTPPALRGRVFTVQFMMASLVGLAPLLIAATLADLIGIPAMLFWLTVGCVMVGGFSLYDAYQHRGAPEESR
ncbi:MAG TPA: MFS transporter [Anaerolineae bacterium]|nr:MFS transporter [Caldilineae bacterium]HID33224.1 MFS transporter [Anaerolineae bacterium]HIQ11933.1 MFS transporter [Caldilineales bacterium]